MPRGRLDVGQRFVHESLIGTVFDCRIEGLAEAAGRPAFRRSVAGWVRVTGCNMIFVDDRDPLAHGFELP
jgi:4-hydroxyproline epimerase